MPTQEEIVLQMLEESPDGITRWDAFKEGITELNTRIHYLRKEGHDIVGKREAQKNRYGKNVQFMRYRLVKEEKE